MKTNMGNADRITRVVLVLIIAALYYNNVVSGVLAWVLAFVAGIFLITSLAGKCPLYSLLGINTCSKKKSVEPK